MRPGVAAEAAGFRVEFHDTIGSTNDRALEAARSGDRGRLWIVAGEQTKGRGRQGRAWRSPQGNLHASLALVSPCAPAEAPQLGFVAGVALVVAVRALAPDAPDVALKWPNDLLVGGAKAAGLLVEGAQQGARFVCAIGVGVNCVDHPQDTPYPATDLSAALGMSVTREALFAALSDAMVAALDAWRGGAGFAATRTAWLASAARLNEPVAFDRGGRRIVGIFETIDVDGRLVLKTQDGRLSLDAGDLLAPAAPGAQRPEHPLHG